jgi:hypothetical protein
LVVILGDREIIFGVLLAKATAAKCNFDVTEGVSEVKSYTMEVILDRCGSTFQVLVPSLIKIVILDPHELKLTDQLTHVDLLVDENAYCSEESKQCCLDTSQLGYQLQVVECVPFVCHSFGTHEEIVTEQHLLFLLYEWAFFAVI